MNFEHYKKIALKDLQEALERKLVDEPIIPYLNIINSHPSFYTTSSCYGRITVDLVPFKENKKDHKWLGKWHRTVTVEEVEKAITSEKGKITWLKQDSFIIHIGADTIDNALKLLDLARNKAGLKRSGIMQIKPRIMLEIIGLDTLASPLYYETTQLYSNLTHLVTIANMKFQRNEERLKHFITLFEQEFS
ncbi:MAG: hypothetical protein GXN99_03365 [Candidatus Nanohaloarchaeota archaeon]|nr:hypothetical protein [Candidatus Nanohaloarchaeota archaeon]